MTKMTKITVTLLALTAIAYGDEPTPEELAACNRGKGQVCLELGDRYDDGQGVAKDESKALGFYLKACKLNVARGCGFAGTLTISTEKDEAKGRGLREKGCSLNDGASCNNLGTSWSEGKEGAPTVDHIKARGYYEKACKLDNGLGCFNLGNVYRLGEGMKPDLKIAVDKFKRSCDLDTSKGCTELAIIYYEGKVVAKDVAKAVSLLDKACKLGSETACKNLEMLRNAKQAP